MKNYKLRHNYDSVFSPRHIDFAKFKSCKNLIGLVIGFLISLTNNNVYGVQLITSSTSWNSSTIPSGAHDGILIQSSSGTVKLTINSVTGFYINGDIIVDGTDCELEINNSSFEFGISSKIKLNKGAKVKLNGVVLDGYDYWNGIVVGESDFHFSTKPSIDNNGNCSPADWAGVLDGSATLLEIDASSIRRAVHGILSDPGINKTGGVVRVRNTDFINCEYGIELHNNYCNRFKDVSASYIMTSNFTWDNGLPYYNGIYSRFVQYMGVFLRSCKGINIGGCNFEDNLFYNTTNSLNYGNSVGVFLQNTTVNISKDGDRCGIASGDNDPCPDNTFANPSASKGCEFKRMDIGVWEPFDELSDKLAIRSSTFTNCLTAVEIGATHNFVFGYNTVKFNSDAFADYYDNTLPLNFYAAGLNINSYNGVGIYNNLFDFTHGVSNTNNLVFIEMGGRINHGMSFIKKNTFSNDVAVTSCGRKDKGIYLRGVNLSLNIKCNMFQNLAFDIQLSPSAQLGDVPLDGGGTIGSGNIYSMLPTICDYSNIAVYSGHSSNIGSVFYENIGTIDRPAQSLSQISWVPRSVFEQSTFTANPCAATVCEDLMVLSTKDIHTNSSVTIYPNPSIGDFTITTKQKIKRITLFSLDGRVLIEIPSDPSTGNSVLVKRSNLGNISGVILVRVEQNGQILNHLQVLN